MRHIKTLLFLLFLCSAPFQGYAQQKQTSDIRVRAEVLSNRVLLRWVPSDAESWHLLNQYGVRLERLTVARSGVVLEQPELKILATVLKPKETEVLKTLVNEHPMGAVVAQAIFGEDFEVSLGESPLSKAIALDEVRQQRYLFSLYAADLCFPVAKEVGWGWEDTDIRTNERYLYRVSSLVPEKKRKIHQGAVFAVANELTKFVRPIGLSAQFSESGALLSWDFNTLSYLYASYFVEKSEDGVHFKQISELPITRMADTEKNPHAPITYLDSVALGKTWYYRVVGVTPFGNKGEYSDIVSGIAYPSLKNAPIITQSRLNNSGGAKLSWQFDDSEQELISGFNILHSSDNKNYSSLIEGLAPQQRDYTLESIGKQIYFKVEAKAKQGVSTQSFPVMIQPIDSIPPSIPQGLTAEIDSLGVVHLSWQANTDEDIYGYRLYRGQSKGGELVPITDLAIRETTYVDSVTIDNLNNKVYYAITALDARYNQSEYSTIIEVLKPNTIPPPAPILLHVTALEDKNLLEWSQSEDPYQAGVIVVRTDVDDKKEQVAWRIVDPTITKIEDKKITPGKSYAYQVVAYSVKNLNSPYSNTIKVKSLMGQKEETTIDFHLEVLPEGISIKWNVPQDNLISISLYKLDDAKTSFLYRENLPSSGELIDKEIYQGQENEYMLLVKSKNHRPITQKKSVQL